MNDKLNINQWAEEDRPREKMMMHGVSSLSNAELLAILIGSGNTEDSAVELMRKVLAEVKLWVKVDSVSPISVVILSSI